MEEGLVSIIVPVYNAEKFLEQTINTVSRQTYENWELLFVNDCSKDNSIKIISKYCNQKIKLINLKKNSGAATARNVGIEKANGQYIAFLDADDLWNENKLEQQIEFMIKNKVSFSFTGYEFADENGIGVGKIVKVPQKISYQQALKNTTIFTSTVVIDLKQICKEDIKMPIVKSEDTATWWKILKQIDYAYGINDNLVKYRRSAGTLSSNKIEAIKRIWNLYRNVEKLGIVYSIYNFCFYAINAVIRRV